MCVVAFTSAKRRWGGEQQKRAWGRKKKRGPRPGVHPAPAAVRANSLQPAYRVPVRDRVRDDKLWDVGAEHRCGDCPSLISSGGAEQTKPPPPFLAAYNVPNPPHPNASLLSGGGLFSPHLPCSFPE